MNLFRARIIAMATLAVLFMLAAAVPASADLTSKTEKAAQEQLVVGQAPPEITLTDLNGEEFILSSLAGEKPVVIDFWATWCGWCVTGFPNLVEFTDMYGDEVEVVGVGVWMDDPEVADDAIATFIEENNLNFRITVNRGSDLAEAYNIKGIPLTVVVDTEGRIAAIFSGYHETLIADLEGVLGLVEE